ncbi:MAG: hypothetical protein AAFZ49_02180 [Cyanobacteria bacterium J06659_2]
MTHWTKQYLQVWFSGTTAIAVTLLLPETAVGHVGHPHRQTTEPESEEAVPAESETVAPAKPSNSSSHVDDMAMPSSDMPIDTTPEAAPIEAVPAAVEEPAPAPSQAGINASGAGLGESLLALIVVGPFLLGYLKKKLQAS